MDCNAPARESKKGEERQCWGNLRVRGGVWGSQVPVIHTQRQTLPSKQDHSPPAVDGRMLHQSFCKVSAFQLLSGARPEGLQIQGANLVLRALPDTSSFRALGWSRETERQVLVNPASGN